MPSRLLCQDDKFETFKGAIYDYLETFTTPKFLRDIASVTNLNNPFKFNETSNLKYMQSHILVFRRVCVRVNRELCVEYCKQGLLDPNHTISRLVLADDPIDF